MAHDIARLLDLLAHAALVVGEVGDVGAPEQIAGVFRPVAGGADVHRLQTVPVDADADRQRLPVVHGLAVLEEIPQRVLQPVLVGHGGEMVLPDAAQMAAAVMALQKLGKGADQPVALVKAVLPVEMLHAAEVEIQHGRLLSL